MKKIAYFSSSLIPSRTANSTQVMKMCSAIAELGYTITLYCKDGARDKKISEIYENYGVAQNFEIIFLPYVNFPIIGTVFFSLAQVWTLFQRGGADIIYGRNCLALLMASLFRADIIYEAHDNPRKGRYLLESLLLKLSKLRGLVLISNSLKLRYKEIFPSFDDRKFIVAHDGADVTDNSNINEIIKLNSGVQLGYVGHLYPGKGMEVIKSLAALRPNWVFNIVGGNDDDIKNWREITSENVVYHGFVERRYVPTILRQFDVLLLPPLPCVQGVGGGDIGKFMSPLKAFEYMSSGTPVVCSDIPAMAELFTNNHDAILVKPYDHGAWIEAIEKLLNDDALSREIADNARKTLVQQYTWARRAKRVIGDVH